MVCAYTKYIPIVLSILHHCALTARILIQLAVPFQVGGRNAAKQVMELMLSSMAFLLASPCQVLYLHYHTGRLC